MPSLRDTIAELASRLASGVLSALRDAPLEELLGELDGGGPRRRGARAVSAFRVSEPIAPFAGGGRGRTRGGARLPRRSADQIEGVVDRIVALLRANPEGLRSEHIRDQLGLSAKELPRPLKEAERDKKIWKEGEKRATTYFAGGPQGGKTGAKKPARSPTAPNVKRATKASKSVASPAKTTKTVRTRSDAKKAEKKAPSAAPPPAAASAPAESAT